MNCFSISDLPLAGGFLGLCPLPGANGDLPADITQIKAWGADLVLSLVESSELAALGASYLPDLLQAAGVKWRHFPIEDFGVPNSALQSEWSALASEISDHLARGGRIVIHCRGGCGRTGTVALRLMRAAGESLAPALLRLRSVRPCAVETAAQMEWASGLT
ncbi:MAG: protein-tyrosine phosphatase [Pseudorhodobacter sp.]|jgi:protein-tyrosine phosphatase